MRQSGNKSFFEQKRIKFIDESAQNVNRNLYLINKKVINIFTLICISPTKDISDNMRNYLINLRCNSFGLTFFFVIFTQTIRER